VPDSLVSGTRTVHSMQLVPNGYPGR